MQNWNKKNSKKKQLQNALSFNKQNCKAWHVAGPTKRCKNLIFLVSGHTNQTKPKSCCLSWHSKTNLNSIVWVVSVWSELVIRSFETRDFEQILISLNSSTKVPCQHHMEKKLRLSMKDNQEVSSHYPFPPQQTLFSIFDFSLFKITFKLELKS